MTLFPSTDRIEGPELEAGLRRLVLNGLFTQAMITLTEGVFLVDLALRLQASNLVIGLLASVFWLAQLLQVPAVWLVQRTRRRKAVAVPALLLSRLCVLSLALVPWAASFGLGIPLLLAGFVLHCACSSVGSCAWNSWMHDLVPASSTGAFYSGRLARMTGAAMALSLAAGWFVDRCTSRSPADPLGCYSVLFLLGCLAGLASVYHLARVPEPAMAAAGDERRFLDTMAAPLADPNFRRLLVFLGIWNFAVNLAAPFLTVYMLGDLGLPMSLVIGLSVLAQGMSLIALLRWGELTDRFSNKSVLRVCGPVYLACILSWTFCTLPGLAGLAVPLLVAAHALMGVATAGVTLAAGNIGLKLAPQGLGTAYLAVGSLVSSLAAGLAPVVGGSLADFFARRSLSGQLRWTGPEGEQVFTLIGLRHWGFFFFFAFVIGAWAVRRLFLVQEAGEVRETVVVQEFAAAALRDLRRFSTATGLQPLVELPLHTLARGLDRLRQHRYIAVWRLKP